MRPKEHLPGTSNLNQKLLLVSKPGQEEKSCLGLLWFQLPAIVPELPGWRWDRRCIGVPCLAPGLHLVDFFLLSINDLLCQLPDFWMRRLVQCQFSRVNR